MKSVFFAAVVALTASVTAGASIPAGYYDRISGKTTADLKTALYEIIYPHTEVSSYNALPTYFMKTDLYPESNQWWDMYSTIPFYAPSFTGLNREHSLPKSWWGGLTNIPAYVDLNHLYPSEAVANQAKSNYPLGEVTGTPKFDNGWSLVGKGIESGGAAYVFEPADEYKGDFARTYFYMVTCYQDLNWKYQYMTRNGTYPSLQNWAIDLLLKWHRQDPVSEKETNRNEAVYLIQNNRNPFIDYPELAEYIWGDKMGQPFIPADTPEIGGTPTLITPVQDMSLDFNEVAVGSKQMSRLFFNGENLTGKLELTLSGADARFFTLAANTIDASQVNSSGGYWLSITYSPTELGEHTARLRVQDGGLAGSIGIELRGECLPVPVLSKLEATAPTDVTSDSYQANWLEPVATDSEVIDYYMVSRTIYRSGSATTEELPAEENYLAIDGFNESDMETYSVQSVRLGYRSEASNVITVSHAGITGVDSATPLAVECYSGLVRFVCSEPHAAVEIFDVSGKLVATFAQITDGFEISLQPGVYLVRTAGHPTPLKISAF